MHVWQQHRDSRQDALGTPQSGQPKKQMGEPVFAQPSVLNPLLEHGIFTSQPCSYIHNEHERLLLLNCSYVIVFLIADASVCACSFGANLMRMAVKVRDGLPIFGLWSRLTATGGMMHTPWHELVLCSMYPMIRLKSDYD